MSQDHILLSSIDDIEANFLSDVSQLNIQDCFISACDVGGLVGVSDWEGFFEKSGGDSMFSYEGPVDTIDLGS